MPLAESRGSVSGASPRKEVAIHAEGKSTGKCEGIRIADARHGDYDAGHLLLQVPEPFFHRRRQRYGGHFEPLYSELHQWRFRHDDQRPAAHRRLHCARQGLRRTHDVCQPADVGSDVGAGAHHSDERADDLPAPHGADFRRQPARGRLGDSLQPRRVLRRHGHCRHDSSTPASTSGAR